MSVKLTALKLSGKENPDTLYVSAAMTNGVQYAAGGDPFSIAAKDMLDPNGVCPTGPNNLKPKAVGVLQEQLGGYYAQVNDGATLGTYKLQFFQPGGAELPDGNYPAAIANGVLRLEIVLDDNDE